jgi:WD40 repeat protein
MRSLGTLALWLIVVAPAASQQPASQAAAESPYLVLDPGGHTSMVRTALFTADGKHVITGGYDKTIRIWDVSSGEPIRVLHLPVGPSTEGSIHYLALSPDGKTLAAGGWP